MQYRTAVPALALTCVLGAARDGQRSSSPTAPSLSARSAATQRQTPAEVTFTKWLTTYPDVAGFSGGNGVGRFAAELLRIGGFDNGVMVQLRARYRVIDPSRPHSFTGGPWPQRVAAHREWPTVDHAAVAYQPRDLTFAPHPYRIVVGQNGYYCVVDAATYVNVADGDLYWCEWQPPRWG